MGLKMAEFELLPVSSEYFSTKYDPATHSDAPFLPYWARCRTQYAQNLLDCSDEPIEYDHDDEDYSDNCFFFPEDCSWTPPKDWVVEAHCGSNPPVDITVVTDNMIPGLPDIKMLDSEALGDLLEDNLSPPEITTMMYDQMPWVLICGARANQFFVTYSVFATNGAVFAYASSLSSRQLRNLSATYGAAYTCYAKNASSGNLTGVNPASHPSSYVTAQSMSLGDVGSIVFELDDSVAVVTRIADKVLLAAVGPSKPNTDATNGADPSHLGVDGVGDLITGNGATSDESQGDGHRTPTAAPPSPNPLPQNGNLDAQHEIDRSADLARLASLNLSASPSVLLALESKCAALGRFLGQKLNDLESPEDF
ncbi:hypothetical protein N7462_010666 [Penicillium macrosclerotiorum]|uniref:uncharacterized protein n=1 Tax=Penicillium macrosclerotiorum TaxID=303699 RepID=UPI002547F505|nr:uncharacterized protein N7462_010666 [Penicillium macrosclerotiorum]KAJ5669596.1 hypothetical protein N7462_010666 [Penicillium macrosclerotiorum]